jgi:SAM-dependent methyltransferase
MPDFQDRDPAKPGFWNERFDQHFTPWDQGGVPQALRQFVQQAAAPLTTLIPGCGAAYEVAYLSEAGWDVTAIDFSPAAVAVARNALGVWAPRVRQADFFSFIPDQPLDLIYERAFLCALPREVWPRIVQRWAELLRPGCLLAGFFFFDDAPKGPPFGADSDQLKRMLAPFFEQIEDASVPDSVAVFAGKERWQVWRRLA